MKNTIASFGVKIELYVARWFLFTSCVFMCLPPHHVPSRCEREIGEWEEVVKMKTEEAEQNKR